jgi:hypothetical protein
LVAVVLDVSGGRRPRPPRRVVMRMLARRTRSRLCALSHKTIWMVGVGHDGMILSGSDATSRYGIRVFYHFICSSYPLKISTATICACLLVLWVAKS